MENNWFMKCVNMLAVFLLIYCFYFLVLHFFYPDIGNVSIQVSPISFKLDSKIITISNPKATSTYYLLIYDDNNKDNWLYFNSSSQTAPQAKILHLFLPEGQSNYLFFEGDRTKNTFQFKLTSKYPINYMSSKEHIFHVEYIVPFSFFPFPNFYYSKHYTFFVEPLI